MFVEIKAISIISIQTDILRSKVVLSEEVFEEKLLTIYKVQLSLDKSD